MVNVTTNPVRWVFALFFLWVIIPDIHYIFISKPWAVKPKNVQAKGYRWGVENCKPLNITEIDDVETFQDGCYYFQGHLRIEGNVTVPPLPETTQCDTLVAYNHAQVYNGYLTHSCNELGQHEECHDYNPACTQDYSDVENGFGYKIKYAFLPNSHRWIENWYSIHKTFELEDLISQSMEWKKAWVAHLPTLYTPSAELCLTMGDGDPSMCQTNQGFPVADQLNMTYHSNIYLDQATIPSKDEHAVIPQPKENLKIYDIGKTSGNVIHLNLAAPWDFAADTRTKTYERVHELFGDNMWKYGMGDENGNLWHRHRSQVPADPDNPQWREPKAVQPLGKVDLYGKMAHNLMYKFYNLVIDESPSSKEATEGQGGLKRNYPIPANHPSGDIIYAPMALGPSFYSDPVLEEMRLNGTEPIAFTGLYMVNNEVPQHPVIWGPEVLKKLQANGGSFTDAEFKALPEYGDPAHFPLATNYTFWKGQDNCPHVEASDEPLYDIGSIRLTPACRIKEPTDKALDWLGLVHKKQHAETGETILVWNPIHFSDEDNSDCTALESARISPIGDDAWEWMKAHGKWYPAYRIMMSAIDVIAGGGTWYGNNWYNNPLNQPFGTGRVFFYIHFHWIQDPFLYDVREHVDGFDYAQNLKSNAENYESQVTKSIFVYRILVNVILWVFSALLIIDNKKRESQQSD